MKTNKFVISFAVWLLLLQLLAAIPTSQAAEYYRVRSGDSLWVIAQKYSVTVAHLKTINGLKNNIIYPDQILRVQSEDPSHSIYIVRPGDNLWSISQRFGVNISALRETNNIPGNLIHPNQHLILPDRGSHRMIPVAAQQPSTAAVNSDEDLLWLARAISSEARGEPFEGQVAVGAVILNRVKSSQFPDSVPSVIFHQVKGVYQFSPVQNGSIYRAPTKEALRAAKEALSGHDPTNGALYFYNPELTSRSNWIRSRPVAKVLSNHVFTL